MNKTLRMDADRIVASSIKAVLPDEAVARALQGFDAKGKVVLVATGKAAWQMAKAAPKNAACEMKTKEQQNFKRPIDKLATTNYNNKRLAEANHILQCLVSFC